MKDRKGTLRDDSGKYSLRFERHFAHPPERVWRALTENDELAGWFPAQVRGAREPGAALEFVFPLEPGQVPGDSVEEGLTTMGQMVVFDAPLVLEYTWEGEVLRWELAPRRGGTRLIFTHTFDDKAKAARDASGWDFCLATLEAQLSGLPAEPFSPERFDVLFADYAQRFGPAAAVRRTPDEWTSTDRDS